MDIQQLILLALKFAILGTVFSYGLKATVGDLLHLVHRPLLLLRSVLAVLVIMPVLTVVMVKILDLRTATEAALVALAISPVPPMLPNKETKAGGHASYALGLLIVMALVAIVAIPIAIWLLAMVFDRPLTVQPGTIARIVFLMIVIPLGVGMIVNALLPNIAARLHNPVRLISATVLAVAAVMLLGGTWNAIWVAIGGGTMIALVAFVICGLAVGHFLGGPEPEHATVLALSTASRHPAIALSVAAVNFPQDRFVGVILLYLLIATVVCIPYIAWQRRRSAARVAAGV
jgi:BASS family bile acid:Na+ symporter